MPVAMTLLSTLLPEVIPQLREPETAAVLQALRQACRDFMEQTWAWEETVTGVALVADQTDYASFNPESYAAEVLAVESVARYTSAGLLAATYAKSAYQVKPDGATISFVYAPLPTGQTSTDTLSVGLYRLPLASCTQIPATVFNRWQGGIVAGALWRLKRMAGKPWHDPQGAADQRDEFYRLVAKAKAERFAGRKSGPISLKIPDSV